MHMHMCNAHHAGKVDDGVPQDATGVEVPVGLRAEQPRGEVPGLGLGLGVEVLVGLKAEGQLLGEKRVRVAARVRCYIHMQRSEAPCTGLGTMHRVRRRAQD